MPEATDQLEYDAWLKSFHSTRSNAGKMANRYHAHATQPTLAYRDSDFERLGDREFKALAEAASAAVFELLEHIAPYREELSGDGALTAPPTVQAPVVVEDEDRGRPATDRGRRDPRVGAIYQTAPTTSAETVTYREESPETLMDLREDWHGRLIAYHDSTGNRQTERVWLPPALAVCVYRTVNAAAAELGWASDVVIPTRDPDEHEEEVLV